LLREAGRVQKHQRRFGAMTQELQELAEWLRQFGVSQVAMESSGVYWKPVWNILEGQFAVVLANAQHIKNVPGRKTDQKDAEWIAQLLQYGLLRASYRLGTTVDSPEFPEVHNRISGAYPNALRWEKTNAEQHAASQAMWVQYDHLLAHALGGTNELSNLVVACAPCNFRRMPPERTAPEFAKAQRERRKVEALFAELKNQIGLRRLRLRRLKFVREHFRFSTDIKS
jgi:hypothetical protein